MMTKVFDKKRKGGFTLIEIMIVVLIIGILLAIAIPNFMKARETSKTKSCLSNLRQIETAKEQWAMEQAVAGTPTPADLLAYIKAMPKCPSAGTDYTINPMATRPTCTSGNITHDLDYVAP